MNVVKSAGSPTLSSSISLRRADLTFGQISSVYKPRRGGGAFLTLILESAGGQAPQSRRRHRRVVGEDEIFFPPVLSDKARVLLVVRNIASDFSPNLMNVAVEPVNDAAQTRIADRREPPTSRPEETGTKLMTRAGRPASQRRDSKMSSSQVPVLPAGFHTTVLPMRAGAIGRLPAIEVEVEQVVHR